MLSDVASPRYSMVLCCSFEEGKFMLYCFFSTWKQLASTDITPTAGRIGSVTLPQQKGQQSNLVSLPSGHFENWGESTMADASPRTDTSTDVDTDEKNQRVIFCSILALTILQKNSLHSGY